MSFLVLCAISLVLILVVISYYLFSKIAASTKSEEPGSTSAGNDALRKHGVTDLASKISYLTSDDSIAWPAEWQQLGTSSSGCEVHTNHCQVTSPDCLDLEGLSHQKFKLPVDAVEGSEEKTGFAIKKENNKLLIRACYTDGSTAISQELRLPN